MLAITLDEATSILTLSPQGLLQAKDFEEVAKVVDPFIEQHGKLKGLIIYVQSFAGWDSFAALVKHMQFINQHHKNISHVAFVTDSVIGDVAEYIGSHFVSAKVKHFPFSALEKAKAWIG